MNLYLIEQTENDGWDTYDSAVVCAASAEDARKIHPDGDGDRDRFSDTWCRNPDDVTVTFLGTAHPDVKAGVVCASFNAG